MTQASSEESAENPLFGSVTAICYAEGNNQVNGCLAFGTSLGYLNFVFGVADDFSKASNRVETFQLKG